MPDEKTPHGTEIQMRAPGDLIPYRRNAKLHSDEQIEKIAQSITEFGFNAPILIDPDGGVIAGHGRLMAAQKLGLEEVPCVPLGHLSDKEKRAYILADNRLGEIGGGWDTGLLVKELETLAAEGIGMEVIGFDADSFNSMMESLPDPDSGEESDAFYTRKVQVPIYEPKGERPEVSDLMDKSKTETLLSEIDAADLPGDVADFLRAAAMRHTVFNFAQIAEFYAHADAGLQDLMEQSALVIIDFDKAIEGGFVRLSKELAEQYAKDKEAGHAG